jgi:hypothetical protein
MGESAKDKKSGLRQCIYCGKTIGRHLMQCPHCREAQTEAHASSSSSTRRAGSGGQFRSGLLLVLLGAVIEYFAGGYSPMTVPDQVRLPMTTYAVPLLFLGGLGMSLYGVFLRIRS